MRLEVISGVSVVEFVVRVGVVVRSLILLLNYSVLYVNVLYRLVFLIIYVVVVSFPQLGHVDRLLVPIRRHIGVFKS